ncbi:MAG: hypothetical protein ACC656_15795, partial [Candidatus Heimdallarchaeota archaeon]
MEDPDVTSYQTNEEDITLRKNFSMYVTNVEFELQRYGIQVTQSEILGYIMEKLTNSFFQQSKVVKDGDLPIDASEDEIARYIINRKYPYVFRFDEENTQLNPFQRFMRNSRINNLSDRSAIRILRVSQSINLLFLFTILFLGTQSLFSLVSFFSSPEDPEVSATILDGDLIYGYSLLWTPSIVILAIVSFIFDLLQTYFVLNIPTLGRIMPKLNDNYNKTILRMKISFLMAFSYISYIMLGSVLAINDIPINDYDPAQDLGIPFLISLVGLFIGSFMMYQLKRERISS